MARTPDPARKPALLEQTLDYLLDKPLSELSFRTLAKALGVSTYVLVYHFGSRAELVRDIVEAISARTTVIQARLTPESSLDDYIEGLVLSWEWAVQPRNRQLQRLEFEAGMLEAVHPDGLSTTRALYERWMSIGRRALEELGLAPEDADAETRLIVNTFHGIQYDLVLNGDAESATASLHRAAEQHRERVAALLSERA
ncbi:TetR/AcrR family transcriptional regulator [Salinibacterium soli]|uniref:TetR/AcrR family transcriptional regulator n=1 Tax=Antiquaquibacter soli TaxID=3064523 RepID=A0ABT9BS61_9MICO|nr:TetR/AcrR family transcriptional regulator [Protaetiibacter sp. WY-16]MDO7883283.1 TetR/AcrR family transcriptional regulator [Protaetiibacter sp. WY-16]